MERERETAEAVYLGVKDYGAKETVKANIAGFLYRFQIGGTERHLRILGRPGPDGREAWAIQNRLKEGGRYALTMEKDTVTAAAELPGQARAYAPPVKGVPGKRTLKNFLKTALMPAGTALYVFGGGWNWQDDGAAVQARTLGVSPDWVRFFEDRDENYTYKSKDGDEKNADPAHSYYPYGGFNEYYYAGLDCSGFLGWALYNTFETESGGEGYVGGAGRFARRLAGTGLGAWTRDIRMPDGGNGYQMKPGDIMSTDGHVWISLGTCGDGSVVILHSTPSKSRTGQPGGGVQISAVGEDPDCEAYRLADARMARHFPEWYRRYPAWLCRPETYFALEGENAGRFTWDLSDSAPGLTDPDGLRDKKPEEVLAALFDGEG